MPFEWYQYIGRRTTLSPWNLNWLQVTYPSWRQRVWHILPCSASTVRCRKRSSITLNKNSTRAFQRAINQGSISVQPPRNTRSSYHVTVSRPPTSSSLRITDRSFRYALPCLCNQLPSSLRQPHSSPSVSDLPVHAPATSSYSLNLPLSPSITPSLFHSLLKTYLFHKSFPPSGLRTDSTALWLVRFFWASRFLFLVFFISLFCLVPCGRLS